MNPEMERSDKPAASGWGALVKVLTDPGATFQALRGRVPILPGYLVQMVIMTAGAVAVVPLTMSLMADQLAKSGMPPEAMGFARISGFVGAGLTGLATPWVGGLIAAALGIFFGQFQGGGVSFKEYLGMAGYARLPLALGALIQYGLTLQANSLADLQTISLSLAALLPVDASPVLRALATCINPFDLWYYALLAIGFGVLHRVKPTKAAVYVGVMFLLSFVMALAGSAAADMQFGM